MRPQELRVLISSLDEHTKRTMITDFLNEADETPDKRADHKEFRRLHDAWATARDAQRLAQQDYSDYVDRQHLAGLKLS